jgi:hypothetical protein
VNTVSLSLLVAIFQVVVALPLLFLNTAEPPMLWYNPHGMDHRIYRFNTKDWGYLAVIDGVADVEEAAAELAQL